MRSILTVTGDLMRVFNHNSGFNFRMRLKDGVLSFKPSTRGGTVKGELFGHITRYTDRYEAEIEAELPVGTFGVVRRKHGWFETVQGEGITIVHAALEAEQPQDTEVVAAIA